MRYLNIALALDIRGIQFDTYDSLFKIFHSNWLLSVILLIAFNILSQTLVFKYDWTFFQIMITQKKTFGILTNESLMTFSRITLK